MAYNKKEQYEKALKLIEEKELFFIEDIVSLLALSKTTFYDFYPPDSNELNTIKEKLEYNRVEVKSSMRSKWYKSEAPALQIALMKMIATDTEAHRLSGTRTENVNINKNTEIPDTKEDIDKEVQKILDSVNKDKDD